MANVNERILDGVLVERWDDGSRTYTSWDANGIQTDRRPYSAQENADADARTEASLEQANESSLHQKAAAALSANATFLALSSPTNAQNAAQVKALTRQCNALIRLAIRDLSSDT